MIDAETIKKLSDLARIKLEEDELKFYLESLNNILALGKKLEKIDTTGIEPMFHSLELEDPMRADQVTETNQRELMQSIAPKTLAGLYLVPKVIE